MSPNNNDENRNLTLTEVNKMLAIISGRHQTEFLVKTILRQGQWDAGERLVEAFCHMSNWGTKLAWALAESFVYLPLLLQQKWSNQVPFCNLDNLHWSAAVCVLFNCCERAAVLKFGHSKWCRGQQHSQDPLNPKQCGVGWKRMTHGVCLCVLITHLFLSSLKLIKTDHDNIYERAYTSQHALKLFGQNYTMEVWVWLILLCVLAYN